MNGCLIKGVRNPVERADVPTKAYVERIQYKTATA